MQPSDISHLSRWQPAISLILAILLALLSGTVAYRHNQQWDWTASSRHSLSLPSLQIVQQLDQPLTLTAFTRDQALAKLMSERVERYQQHNSLISFIVVNPDRQPELAAAENIKRDGVLHLSLGDHSETLTQFDEQTISNAILRLSRGTGLQVLILAGHGERAARGKSNHDLGNFSNLLIRQGFAVERFQIDPAQAIPTNNSLLIISAPDSRLAGSEVIRLMAYVADGGRLLWLGDPGEQPGLKPLAIQLGIRFLPGTLVDPAGMEVAGSGAFTLATASHYRGHPITQQFQLTSVFPLATGLSQISDSWQAQPLAVVGEQGWLEQGSLGEGVSFDKQQDLTGPVTLALALSRPAPDPTQINNSPESRSTEPSQQRAVVVGDGDFLANAYLGNGGNQQLGLNMVNWLAGDERLINIQPTIANDSQLDLTPSQAVIISLGFLVGLPLLFAGIGLGVWWRRR